LSKSSSISNKDNSSGMAVISLDLSLVLSCPKTYSLLFAQAAISLNFVYHNEGSLDIQYVVLSILKQ